MEKLQAAIETARRRREARLGAAPDTTSLPPSSETWDALAPFTPDPRVLDRHRVVANTRGPARNALDLLRTRLLKLMGENGWRRVMITSPTAGCGKTTVAANLALALQRRRDLSTIVMDFDLIGARLGETLGLEPEHEVADLITGEVTATEQMYRIGTNLAVSASRRGNVETSELLKSSDTEARVAEIERQFTPDIMLFDFPPCFVNDDVISAARFVDCAIIVGASEQTSISEIDMTERDLSQYTNIAGVVLNKYRYGPKKSGYGYPYS